MRYINEQGEFYNGRYVIQNGVKYLSPSEAKLLALGYRKVEEEVATYEPTTEERVWELKARLAESDYKAIKYAEGWISDEDYAAVKNQRQAWRARINALEGGGA